MAADDFTWEVNYASSADETCAVRETKYGDGYVQAVGDGINNIAEVWNVVMNKRLDTEIQAVIEFLRGYGGHTSFLWTPPGDEQKRWRCKTWKRTFAEYNLYNLTFSLEKVNVP